MFLVGAVVFGFSAALGVDGCWSNNTSRRWPLWGNFFANWSGAVAADR